MFKTARNCFVGFSLWVLGTGCASKTTAELPVPALPGVSAEMMLPAFWINQQSNLDDIIMSQKEIDNWNVRIRDSNLGVVDLIHFPASLAGESVRAMIQENVNGRVQEGVYSFGQKPLTAQKITEWNTNLNLQAIPQQVAVELGMTVRRTMLRAFPTSDKVYSSPDNVDFDSFVESAIPVGKPLVVLHTSKDGQWRYVRVAEFDGWAKNSDIATTTNRQQWGNFVSSSRKLVILASHLWLGENPYSPEFSNLQLDMGNAYPVLEGAERPRFVDRMETSGHHVVSLPVRLPDGQLAFKPALIPFSADVRVGYLPLTRSNILRQAFKMQGERYGWGGDFGTRDCSFFVADVYRTMGFVFPRNSRTQLSFPAQNIKIPELASDAERAKILRRLSLGSLVGWNGHIMLYLGEHDGQHYVIQAGAAFGDSQFKDPDGKLTALLLNQVAVTSLSTLKATGKSYLQTITRASFLF